LQGLIWVFMDDETSYNGEYNPYSHNSNTPRYVSCLTKQGKQIKMSLS
jgi:hypothetical protein